MNLSHYLDNPFDDSNLLPIPDSIENTGFIFLLFKVTYLGQICPWIVEQHRRENTGVSRAEFSPQEAQLLDKLIVILLPLGRMVCLCRNRRLCRWSSRENCRINRTENNIIYYYSTEIWNICSERNEWMVKCFSFHADKV